MKTVRSSIISIAQSYLSAGWELGRLTGVVALLPSLLTKIRAEKNTNVSANTQFHPQCHGLSVNYD